MSSFAEEAIDNELYEEWPRQYSPNELAKIAEALGLKSLSSEMEEDLQEIAEGYCWTDLSVPRKGKPETMGLRWRTRNDHLRRIAKLAGQLARCHQNSAEAQAQFGELMKLLFERDGIDGPTSQLLVTQYTDQQLARFANRLGTPEANTAFADLRGAAKRALDRTKRLGRPRDPRWDLVKALADFYERHMGRGPRRSGPDSRPGPFERLVIAALEPLDRAAVHGIRDVIRAVLEARRTEKSNPAQ